LKTRKLLILQNAKNDKIAKNVDNWNVSGTQVFEASAVAKRIPRPDDVNVAPAGGTSNRVVELFGEAGIR
jgi:hypothetical protein